MSGTLGDLPAERLQRNWTYVPSESSLRTKLIRLRAMSRATLSSPSYRVISGITARAKWSCYFVFAPDGQLQPYHRFTLERLKKCDTGLCVIFASEEPRQVPRDLLNLADAVLWKELRGYDFSAYRLALAQIAQASPGADVLLMNDSVMGPFTDLREFWERSAWDLTGFTGFSLIENHVQSYAFMLRDVTDVRLRSLKLVLPANLSWDHFRDVVFLQETRFARVAAASMSVGALWFSDAGLKGDPTLSGARTLLGEGFPFLKRSLLGKHGAYIARQDVLAALIRLDHPLPETA